MNAPGKPVKNDDIGLDTRMELYRVQVEIRDRKLTATVVKLPFVRNGKALVS